MKTASGNLFRSLILAAVTLSASSGASAHHSFAVHFLPEGEVTVTGVVTSFRFANPHGVIELTALDENGNEVLWRAETNSPNLLRRRGWTRDSVPVGEQVTMTGWPAREDEHYMRIRSMTYSDGSVLSTQRGAVPDQD